VAAKLIIAGFIIALAPPFVFWGLAALAQSMPGCVIRSGLTAHGCSFLGVNFNWLVAWVPPVALISYFSAPLGVLVTLAGAIGSFFSASPKEPRE
jgi:hypothetical protein